jgi:hypothetical protein
LPGARVTRTIDPMRARTWLVASLGLLSGCSGCDSCSSDHHEVPFYDAGNCDGGDCDPPDLDGSTANEDGGQDSGPPGDAGLDGGMDASPEDAGNDATVGDGDGGTDGGDDAAVDAGPTCVEADAEVCNGVDDDCDGRSDEELLEISADDSLSFDLPSGTLANEQRGFAQLLPRTADSAWLLHKPLALSDGASGLDVSTLDQTGALVGTTQIGLLPTGRVFLGASLGDFVAVLWRDTDENMDNTPDGLVATETHLTLFEAVAGVLTQRASTNLGGPADISELELQLDGNGDLRLFAAYAPWSITGDTATLTPTVLHHFRYDDTGMALVEVAETTLPAGARPTVHVLQQPCSSGWLIGYWMNTGGNTQAERQLYVRSLSLDGAIDLVGAPLLQVSGHALQGFASAPRCAVGVSPLLVIADAPAAIPDGPRDLEAFELSFDHDTGAVTELGSVVLAENTAFTRIARHGGQWYVTLRNFDLTPTGVFEVDVVNDRVRDIAIPAGFEQGGLSGLPAWDVNMYFIPTHGIVRAGQGLLVTFSNARPETSPLGADTIAVTHRLGCPAPD